MSTRVAGTIVYLAPEYAMCGRLTEKADVFGFGVVALEILSGRPNSDDNLDPEKIYLLEWAWTLHENDQSLGLVDPRLTEFDEKDATSFIKAALLCTQASPMMRPSMSRVVAILSGDIEASTVMSKPSYLADWDFKDVTTTQVAFWWMMIPHQLRAVFSSTISLKGAQPVLAPGLTLPRLR